MPEIRCICALYLLVTPGTGIITKYVCSGDSVMVFETVTFDSPDTVVSLYINHKMHTLIAQWHMQNSTIKTLIQPEYKKVYLDEYGSIWIQNVNHWDEESYFIESGIGSSYVKYEVKINIKVAPKKTCKPKITHVDKLLIAHLEAEDCGIPVASLQWLDYPGLSNISGSVINLLPGHEASIYYACIKGPALECAKISVPSDYCSSYAIGENDSPTLASTILDLKTAISVIVPSIIVFGSLVLLLIVALHLCQKIRRKINKECNPINVTLLESGSGTEDNQRQLKSSQEVITPGTCRNPSSDTFSEPGPSGIQTFNMDEQGENPEWKRAQAERKEFFGVFVKDSNSGDECKVPLLDVHDDQKPKAKML